MSRAEIWRHFDFWLLGAVAILVIFGVAMLNSAVAGNIELIENQTVQRQVIFGLAGFVVILILASIDYHLWVSISRVLYVVLAVFLALVLVAGEAAFGATRALEVGFAIIQPSELAKFTMILVLADFFAQNKQRINRIPWILRSLLLNLGLVGLVILQPDLSTSIVLVVIWFALLWASGLEWRHLALLGAIGLVLPLVSFPFLEDYQQQRLVNFLFPNPEARYGASYNVNQALISIGSGGWLGQGYGQGTQVQLRFLKVRHSDFIFATISEELGFVGAVFVLALLLFVLYRVLRAARLARDPFGALIAYGVATWIGFQVLINVGMNLNMLPVTGLPLPFISQGGSSLLSLMLGVGLVESVVTHHKTLEF